MGYSIERFERAQQAIQGTSLGEVSMEQALEAVAAATGAFGGELIGLGSRAAVPFNIMTGLPPEAAEEFVAAGGGDPGINSRVRAGLRIRPLESLDEYAFTTQADIRRHEPYGDWIARHDVANICLTPLVKTDDLLIGLAVIRNARQGNFEGQERRAFDALAREMQGAVRTQMALQHQSLELMTGVLDAMSAAVFLCDQFGRVRAMTGSAEAVIRHGRCLSIRSGVLQAARQADGPGLESILAEAVAGRKPDSPIVLNSSDGDEMLLMEAAPVSVGHPLRFGVCAMLIVRDASGDEARIAGAASAMFGMTAAEAAISAQLALGRPPGRIAGQRGVAVGTVRAQVRRIFEKAGVSSQLELAAMLARFG